MKIRFLQTADHWTNIPMDQDLSDRFLHAIHEYTNLSYSCEKTENGYFLNPIFRKSFWRNSFLPEISVSVSESSNQTCLHLEGQPIAFVRSFVSVCCIGSLVLGLFALIIMLASGEQEALAVIIPVVICIYSYLLCQLATKITFHNVLRAIKREFP